MKKIKCSLKRFIALLVAIALILESGKFEIKKEVKASEANFSVVNAYYTPSAKEKSEAKAQDKKLNTELEEVKKAKEENDKSSEIDKELKKYRTTNSTTYLLKNGKKKLEIFSDEIRFKDNGKWKNYNPCLKQLDKKDSESLSKIINKLKIKDEYEYINISGDSKQYFPSGLDNESNIIMSKNDYVIAFSPSNIESLVDLEKRGESDSEKEKTKSTVDGSKDNITSLSEENLNEENEKTSDKTELGSGKLENIDEEEKSTKTTKLDVDSVNAQKIKYKDSGKKIEFSYESLAHGVKEEIVLNDKLQTNTIEFDFKLKGLKIISNKYDRELRIVDCKTDKLVAYISEPFITDNKGEITYENIEYKLKDDKIQLVINSKYLSDRNTSYPITIDPTVVWMGDRLESASVSNFQYSLNNNIKHTDKICLRNKNMQFSPYTDTVEMCYIDTSGIDKNNALAGDTSYFYGSDVSEATLSMVEEGNAYMLGGNYPYTFNPGYVDVRTPSSTWNPNTITWNNHPAIGSYVWAQFETTGIAGKRHDVDITDWAQAVADRTIPNTGLALKMTNEGTGALFYSSSFNNYNRMRLSIIYEDTYTGERDSHSYENIEMANGIAMVELSKGNLLYKQEDFYLPSPNMNLNITRIYNSRNTEKGAFGIGWSCEYDARILDENFSSIVYKDGTGAIWEWEFGLQQGTNWKCNQNPELSIDIGDETKNVVITNYSNGQSGTVSFTSHIRISDKEKITRYFDGNGKLRLIEDANGNFIYVKYHSTYGLIQKIYSKQGQKISFSYSNDGEDYYINKTTLEDGSSYNYSYNNERLVKVIHEGSNHGEIEYNYAYYNGKLTKVTDAEGEDYNISYCDKSVEEIEKPNGDTILFYVCYEPEKTRVYKKDNNNTVLSQEDYVFDNEGKVCKKADDAGNEINYTYEGSLQAKVEEKAGYNKLVNNIVQEISSGDETGPVLTEDTSYNARNNVSTETDEEGNVTTYTYGDSINPDQPTLVVTMNPNDEITSKVKYEYNTSGKVVKECDYIENTVTTYTYDSNGSETHSTETLVDEDINIGNVSQADISNGLEASDSQSQYDSLGNDTSNSTIEGTVSTSEENVYDTDDLGRLTSSTDEKNIQTSYEYDEFGRTTITTVDIPNKPSEVSTTQYDDNGRITSEIDKYGRETTYLYDNMGRVISKTISYDGTSKTTSTSYGYEYNVYIITGKASNKRYPVVSTITERNENNEVISKKYIEPYGKTVREEEYGIVKDFTYDMQGNVYTTYERGTSSTNARSPKLTVTLYDKNGKLTDTIYNPIYRNGHFTVDANNSIVESNTYDNAGNLIQEKDSKGNITTYEYNEEGKVTKVSLPDSSNNGNDTLYAYNIQNFDSDNKLISTKDTTTNAKGNVSTTTYNGAGQVISVADKDGNWAIKTSYDYDASGNKSKETHQDGGYITYNYNAKNQLTESKEYNSSEELQKKSVYSYNSDDLLASVVDYKKSGENQTPYRYTYYGYDDFGKITSFAEIDGSSTPSDSTINSHKLRYKYDIEDKLIEIRYPKTSEDSLKGIKLEYNGNKWLTTIKAIIEEDNEEILRNLRTYTYYNDSRVKTINDYRGFLDGSNGYINKTYEYDVFDRVTEMEYKDSSNLNEVLEKHTYSYDKNSNILSEEYINNYPSSQSDRINETRVYTYDSLNRLKTSRVTNNTDNTDNTEKNTFYTYDKVGNITQVIEGNVTTNNSYNGFNQLTQSKVYTNGQFTEQKNYTYDVKGNQISEKTMVNPPTVTKTVQKEYDINNQLTKVTYRNGGNNGTITHVQENKYNSSGKRISRIDDGAETRFFYQGDTLLYTTDSNGDKKCQNIVGPQDNVIATIHYDNGEKVFFYNKDIKTSITNVVDDSGDGVVRYSYDDFGETTKSGNTSFYNEICYTGGVYDELTGQYYLNARYYNPDDCTFITQDTYRGEQKDYSTWNLYAYCGGNPINSVDPSGHNKKSVKIPKGKGTIISYMGYHLITSPTSKQYKLKSRAIKNKDYCKKKPEYYSMIKGRILIATRNNIGGKLQVDIGDYLDVFFKKSGHKTKKYKCIVGDIKGDDAGNKWGHYNGKGVVEVIYHNYNPPKGYNKNKNNPWGKGKVTKITRLGEKYNY